MNIKFGIKAIVNGEVEHFHFQVETEHPHALLALKSWATYTETESQHWIRPGKDFVFSTNSDCVGLFNALMLVEHPEQSPAPRMEFYRQVMEKLQFSVA